MNPVDIICIVIAALAVTVAVVAVLRNRSRTKRTIEVLGTMIDAAINDSFNENTFDESTLSALEAKLGRYLAKCSVSSRNLLIEKDKIKTLISDISHQTKTPIANILLYTQLLGEHQLPEDCRVCVKALSTQAEKLNFLIGALVKTSRLESGIISVVPKTDSVQRMLNDVAEQIRPKAQAKNITLLVDSTADTASFDLKWTTEAVYNIVDNAVKYSPEDSYIRIKAVPYELFSRIDITDEGIGINEAEHSKIFTRFYRSPVVSEQDGVGIGLFLAREILAAQGGYIKVQSGPGQGSTFSVFLPRPG
ncbi:MAG: sensor histidine kinase [Chitinophagales bacterium]